MTVVWVKLIDNKLGYFIYPYLLLEAACSVSFPIGGSLELVVNILQNLLSLRFPCSLLTLFHPSGHWIQFSMELGVFYMDNIEILLYAALLY